MAQTDVFIAWPWVRMVLQFPYSSGKKKTYLKWRWLVPVLSFSTLSADNLSIMLQKLLAIPEDILWEIINHLWHSSLSVRERTDFMVASLQISRSWMNLFVHIAYRDVYVPSQSYLSYFLHVMRLESSVFRYLQDLPNRLCRSITIEIEPQEKTAAVLADFMYMVKAMGILPNLQTLVLRYHNITYRGVMKFYQFIDLPARLQRLEVHFDASTRLHPDCQCLQSGVQDPGEEPPWYLPNLRKLSIFGAKGYDDIVFRYLLSCPQLRLVETNFPIPDSIRLNPKILSASPSTYMLIQKA